MSLILLLDSSDQNLSVGIAKDNEVIYRNSFYAWQRQSEYMIPEIEKALKEVDITLKEIDEIALGIGPGSYTGIRIPLSIAKTLNALFDTPIKALSSLRIMGTSSEKYIALMNARSNRSYIGIYDLGEVVLKDQVVTNEEVLDIIEKYLKEGYVLKGSLDYLKKGYQSTNDVIDGLLSHSLICEAVINPISLCPTYLKD